MFNAGKFANDMRDTMEKARVKVKQSLLQQLLNNGDISAEVYCKEVSKLLDELLFNQVSVADKPQDDDTITVNGFKVPKPMSEKPNNGDYYYIADPCDSVLFRKTSWDELSADKMWLCRNICHTTKEAAVAHAKAMLGIDPRGDK